MKFNSLIPELSVSDINKSKEFYLKIGFRIIYERVEDNFIFLQLEDNQIMIEQNNDNWNTGVMEYPYGRGINISMTVKNKDDMYKKIKENNITLFQDLKTNEYRVNDTISYDKEFLIQDPDGYLLRFND